MFVLALNGSPDKNGNTAFLLDEILKYCQEAGADTETAWVQEAVMDTKTPFCVNCSTPCSKQCYAGGKLDALFKKMLQADCIIFGSPVYFGSMTAQLKALFDKTRDIRAKKQWLGKPMAAVSVGASKYGGQERTVEAIQSCALVSGMSVLGNSAEASMGHFGVSAQKPAQEDTYALNQCKVMAQRIMAELKK